MASVTSAELGAKEQSSRLTLTPVGRAITVVVIVAFATVSYLAISRQGSEPSLYNPLLVALMLVANLIAGSALMVLLGRGIARRHAARTIGSGGELHVRLVGLFSVMAATPMVLVSIVASLLFQYGVQFWFSDQSRGMLDNAVKLAHASYNERVTHWAEVATLTANDMAGALRQTSYDDPRVQEFFGKQVFFRGLSDGILFAISPKKDVQTYMAVNPDRISLATEITAARLTRLRSQRTTIVTVEKGRISALTAVPGFNEIYLYTATAVNMGPVNDQIARGQAIQSSYHSLIARSRGVQLRFNAALLALSLLIVGFAVWVALRVADRLVRPVGELVGAAERVAEGDLSARVPERRTRDELGVLSRAFNTMTGRIQQQNAALDQRRALIEAVMAGVSAGVVATAANRSVTIANSSAARLLGVADLVGRPLAEVAPELDRLVVDQAREAIVQVGQENESRTLAVRLQRGGEAGTILTFDDITQQQLDQRRAAWSDVARRIAHEIKNPLTPIQLAAERLQRRYGSRVEEGDTTFSRLTDTIVRQVGDLRRMVDEFSSFARMPKPVFHNESLDELVRQTLFLHEVAHPAIRFALHTAHAPLHLVCDRRLLGQALTNLVKNAVEAIETRGEVGGAVTITLATAGRFMTVEITDTGVGLPADRDRLVEPYVTTRARGTGLGLAIVKKIVEEHHGTMSFSDRDEGGTIVLLTFDTAALSALPMRDDREDTALLLPAGI